MGFWLIALALIILMYLLINVFDVFHYRVSQDFFVTICNFAVIVFFLLGIFGTPAGYEETELVREVKLVSSNDASELNYQGKESYVTKEIVSIDKKYGNTYNYIIYYELPSALTDNTTKVYTREEIKSSNVTIIENSGQVAIMQEYVTRPKKTFWAFGFGQTTREYIINIPKNTVLFMETPKYK